MLGEKADPYDIIISGAGPAGLTAGIVAGRKQLKAIVIEKEAQVGIFPRGETLHSAKIFSQILGSDVLNMIGTHMTASRKFHSPLNKYSHKIYRHSPSICYDWNIFMKLMEDRLKETETELRLSTKVLAPIFNNRICIGVKLENGQEIYGKTILACDGYQSELGKSVGVPYDIINCPIIKRKVSNYNPKYQGFEYYILPVGGIKEAPRFPPSSLFIFPHGEGKAEIGLLILTPQARKLQKYCDFPGKEEILRVWNILFEKYPDFSEKVADTKEEFQGISAVATGKVFQQPKPKMGLLLIGGSMGFVEASGGSGIVSGMQHAKHAVDYIASKNIQQWDPAQANRYIRDLKKRKFWKHIIRNGKSTQRARNYVFLRLRTPESINKQWTLLKRFL